uniref:Uncharacterized protein n=1 Tax=viral metagenome TaxID=1070528 RepID=A0A6C0KY15_9ZZZZ
MIFRKFDGTLTEINRMDYKNDEIYYKKIMNAKCYNKSNENLDKSSSSYTKKIVSYSLEETLYNGDNQYKNED